MRCRLLCSVILTGAAVSAAAAKTTTPQATTTVNPTTPSTTLVGCVRGGTTGTDPLTLSNFSAISPASPGGSNTAAPPSAVPPPTVGQPPPVATTPGVGSTNPIGTTGTTPAAGSPPAVGAGPAPGATSPVTAPGSTVNSYRLSGTDMRPFLGQQVAIVGALLPSPNEAATAGAASSGVVSSRGTTGTTTGTVTTGRAPMPAFHVQSVTSLNVRCQ
jgi:hypothetical protein